MYRLKCEFSDLVHSYIEEIGRKFLVRMKECENSYNRITNITFRKTLKLTVTLEIKKFRKHKTILYKKYY